MLDIASPTAKSNSALPTPTHSIKRDGPSLAGGWLGSEQAQVARWRWPFTRATPAISQWQTTKEVPPRKATRRAARERSLVYPARSVVSSNRRCRSDSVGSPDRLVGRIFRICSHNQKCPTNAGISYRSDALQSGQQGPEVIHRRELWPRFETVSSRRWHEWPRPTTGGSSATTRRPDAEQRYDAILELHGDIS